VTLIDDEQVIAWQEVDHVHGVNQVRPSRWRE
jgi:hypothetical protein